MMQDFSEAQEAIFLDGLQYMREAATAAEGTGVTREDILTLIADQGSNLPPGQLVVVLAFAVMRLIEEEREHARHRDELRDAHNDLLNIRGILSPNGYEPKTPLPLVPTVAPAVEWLVAELEATRRQVDNVTEHAKQVGSYAVQRQAERDEARAELAKAGEEIRQLRADRTWEAKRANEAARLSADARDDAEARDAVIAELREHIEVVEGDRLTMLAWAMNVLAEHGVEHEHGEEFPAIVRFIRELKDTAATYRHVADRTGGSDVS